MLGLLGNHILTPQFECNSKGAAKSINKGYVWDRAIKEKCCGRVPGQIGHSILRFRFVVVGFNMGGRSSGDLLLQRMQPDVSLKTDSKLE